MPNAGNGDDECNNDHSEKDADDAAGDVWNALFAALKFMFGLELKLLDLSLNFGVKTKRKSKFFWKRELD